MGQRTGVLGKLARPERPDIGDALDRSRTHIGGEFLVAIDRQPFLEAELEPVAAGDPVAGPVVEIFVRDDRFDSGEIEVGCGLRVCQHELVIEDIEALVLHRAHVEVRHRDDHEDVEIVFAAIGLFVPAHAALEGVHGVGALVLFAVLAINAHLHCASGGGCEAVGDQAEVTAHHGEQIGRLGEGVVPHREMPIAALDLATVDHVAVGQEHRRLADRRLDPGCVDRQHVRPIEEIGDPTKTLCLALGAVGAAGAKEPHQLGVAGGIDLGGDLQFKRLVRNLADNQAVGRHLVTGGIEAFAVDGDRHQGQFVTVELQFGRSAGGPERERGRHGGGPRRQPEIQVDGVDGEIGWSIILEADLGIFGFHGARRVGGCWRRCSRF